MPIKVADNLPAKEILNKEHIFIMDESRAYNQNIRALKIVILNLMPIKQDTEVQLLRLIGNTPLQVDVTFLHMESHDSKNTSIEYLNAYYKTFADIKNQFFDGMIITGAPIEHLKYEEVSYWNELCEVMQWSNKHVTSTFHICWGAQAGLYYHYGINKHPLPKKMFGIFEHTINELSVKNNEKLLMGFDDVFYVPHSRHTEIKGEDIVNNKNLTLVSNSRQSGVYMVLANKGRQIFVTGHSEYDRNTLDKEYKRDLNKGLSIDMPLNYYFNDDKDNDPVNKWSAHANLLFSNWLNYYVYQETPFEFAQQ